MAKPTGRRTRKSAAISSSRLECDVVMAGGITSGIVYPGAVSMISKRYTFRSIGGTSVGAIAAAATAAAEFGRTSQNNEDAFDGLAQLHDYLGKRAADGHSRLLHLFRPDVGTAPMFSLLLPFLGGGPPHKQAFGFAVATLRQWPILIAIVLAFALDLASFVAIAHSAAGPSLWLSAIWAGLTFLAAIPVVWIAALLSMVLLVWLPSWQRNRYGLCTGSDPAAGEPDTKAYPGFRRLMPWLHALIQELAGLQDSGAPLTFGDLWQGARRGDADPSEPRQIDLAMIVSDISRNRTMQLPFVDFPSPLYIDKAVLNRFFPEPIATWVANHPDPAPLDGVELPSNVVRLPLARDIPIAFAARLSLSFPFVLSAVPLLTPDFAKHAPGGALDLRNVWLSDGGLTSNFPIHFFDSPIPSRPTFGINLVAFDNAAPGSARDQGKLATIAGSRNGRGSQPLQITSGKPAPRDPVWQYITMTSHNEMPEATFTSFGDKGSNGIIAFAKAILDTARGAGDNQLLLAPGTRDRIVNVALRKNEGGLNLDMDTVTISDLDFRGRAAGLLISDRFDPTALRDPETNEPAQEVFPNHRWVRYRNFMAAFEAVSRQFINSRRRSDAAAAVRSESSLEKMIKGQAPEPLGYYKLSEEARDYFDKATKGLSDLARAMEIDSQSDARKSFDPPPSAGSVRAEGAAPKPAMRYSLKPLVGPDPRSEYPDAP